MKILIASDIHGSAYWCEKLLNAYERSGAEKLLLLGDILYHGPRNPLPDGYAPKEVAKMLNAAKSELLCVRGNCDSEVDQMVLDFPIMAEYCILYTGSNMILATHGHNINEENPPSLKEGDFLLHGHIHIPWRRNCGTYTSLNPGSVALPIGGSRRTYMTMDGDGFKWYHLEDGTPADIQETQWGETTL